MACQTQTQTMADIERANGGTVLNEDGRPVTVEGNVAMFGPNTRRTPGQNLGSENQTGKGTGKNNRLSLIHI